MAIEIMLNAANVNLVAFWRYGPVRPEAGPLGGVILAIFVLTGQPIYGAAPTRALKPEAPKG